MAPHSILQPGCSADHAKAARLRSKSLAMVTHTESQRHRQEAPLFRMDVGDNVTRISLRRHAKTGSAS